LACEPGRSYGGDRGHLLQRGRKTRRRRETRLTRWDRGVSDGARVRSGRADDARAGPRDELVGLLRARRAEAECSAGLRLLLGCRPVGPPRQPEKAARCRTRLQAPTCGPSAGLAGRERNGPAGERGGLRVGLRRFWVFWVLGFAFSSSKLFSS